MFVANAHSICFLSQRVDGEKCLEMGDRNYPRKARNAGRGANPYRWPCFVVFTAHYGLEDALRKISL